MEKQDEHENPGEATLQVLHGRVTLRAGEGRMERVARRPRRHPRRPAHLRGVEDSVVLLTVGMRP